MCNSHETEAEQNAAETKASTRGEAVKKLPELIMAASLIHFASSKYTI